MYLITFVSRTGLMTGRALSPGSWVKVKIINCTCSVALQLGDLLCNNY